MVTVAQLESQAALKILMATIQSLTSTPTAAAHQVITTKISQTITRVDQEVSMNPIEDITIIIFWKVPMLFLVV